VTAAFTPQVTGGLLAQFFINERCKSIQSLLVALTPRF
jgi:hypothetical protein